MWEYIKSELGPIEMWGPNEPIEVGALELGRLLADAEALLPFIKVAQEAERIMNEAHYRADHYGYDLMRTVLRPLLGDEAGNGLSVDEMLPEHLLEGGNNDG